MGKRKRNFNITPKKRRGRPRKDRTPIEISHKKHKSISHADRMKIVLLADAGKAPTEIAKIVGCGWDAAVMGIIQMPTNFLYEKRWSDRAEEVLQTGSVKSKQKSGRTPIFSTPEHQKKLYKKVKKSTVSAVSR